MSYEKLQWHAIIGAPPVKDPKLWMVKFSARHDRQAVRRMESLIDLEDPNQHKYYEGKKQAANNCMYGFNKQSTMFRQQETTTRKAVECPGTGHW